MGEIVGSIPNGTVFCTESGMWAVKSEYSYPDGNSQCILLSSGEYAHFPKGDDEPVRTETDPEELSDSYNALCNSYWKLSADIKALRVHILKMIDIAKDARWENRDVTVDQIKAWYSDTP